MKTKQGNRMKNKYFLLAAVIGLVAVTSVQAIPIAGEIDMSGTANLNSTLLGSATKASSFGAVSVGGVPTGSYVGTLGDSVNWNGFGWNPATTPVNPLWSFTDAGTGFTYSFNLATVGVVSQDNSFLNLLGTGTLTITGAGSPYDTTDGQWSFTISNPGGGAHANFSFTFANSQTGAGVPDGGMTVILLGTALAGLGLLRRKLA
jgi:VPDSG-CTERM motif